MTTLQRFHESRLRRLLFHLWLPRRRRRVRPWWMWGLN